MRWDQVCMRVMLWSLGVTAFLGVAAIFASGSETLVRLLGTSVLTAAAAGLLWPLTRLADEPATKVAGLTGLAVVLVDFCLILLLLWGSFASLDSRFQETLAWASFFVIATALPAVVFLLFLHHPAGWLAARVGVAASAITFVELMLGTWHLAGRYSFPNERWLEAAGATALFGFLGVCCLVGTLQQRPWRWAGVIASLVGWLILSVHFFQPTNSPAGEVLFTVVTAAAMVAAYANLYMLPRLAPRQEVFRLATIALGILTGVLVAWLIIDGIVGYSVGGLSEGVERLAAACGILTACGSVAILILALVHRSHSRKSLVTLTWVEMAITCPSCGEQQKVPLGHSACSKCRLTFFIRVGERKA
jgi:hypothetical protein